MNKNRKPIILIFSAYYLPGYLGGGPIRSISNLISSLSDEFQFLVFTSDRDLGEKSPYEGIKINAWNEVGKARVFYADSSTRTLAGISRFLGSTDYDLLYLNSFFDFEFTVKPLIIRLLNLSKNRPTLLAPRGEFSAGALRVKYLKKIIFLKFAKIFYLYRNINFHASNELEFRDISRAIPNFITLHSNESANIISSSPISIASDLCAADEKYGSDSFNFGRRGGSNVLKVCFLSRISPKKNLDFALNVLSGVTSPIEFTIYGPQEDKNYWKVCQTLISNLPDNIVVNVAGGVPSDQIHTSLVKHDLFFLPTHGENFGHVFVEAWASGLPVLVSDQTPWRGLAKQNIGWDIPLNQRSKYIHVLEEAANYSHEQWAQIRECCVRMASEQSCNIDARLSNKILFSSILSISSY